MKKMKYTKVIKQRYNRLEEPHFVIEENHQARRNAAPILVDMMFEAIKQTLPGPPYFLLCILPDRENSDIYGPWKRKCLVDFGIITQCIAPTQITDQYLTNLLLKINAKVVSSRKWPLISQYSAPVHAQSARVEMIDGLFKPVSPDKDEGMIRQYEDANNSDNNKVVLEWDKVCDSVASFAGTSLGKQATKHSLLRGLNDYSYDDSLRLLAETNAAVQMHNSCIQMDFHSIPIPLMPAEASQWMAVKQSHFSSSQGH